MLCSVSLLTFFFFSFNIVIYILDVLLIIYSLESVNQYLHKNILEFGLESQLIHRVSWKQLTFCWSWIIYIHEILLHLVGSHSLIRVFVCSLYIHMHFFLDLYVSILILGCVHSFKF